MIIIKDDKIYSIKEIQSLTKNIQPIHYIWNDDTIEEFKQIQLYGQYIPYIISSYGRVFSINFAGKFHHVVQLKTNINKCGYERITITYQGITPTISIHRLVALAFIFNDDPDNKIEVNHKDGSKTNNGIWNLEWVTPDENINHAVETSLRSCTPRKYDEDQIIHVCEMIVDDIPLIRIMEDTNVSLYTIKDILRKRTWVRVSSNYDLTKYHYGQSDEDYKTHINNIYKVCQMLEDNFPYKIISKETNMSEQSISRILCGYNYKEISSHFDFSEYSYGRPINYNETLHTICKMAESGMYSMREISRQLNISYRVVQHLLYGETHKHISEKYNLSKYQK